MASTTSASSPISGEPVTQARMLQMQASCCMNLRASTCAGVRIQQRSAAHARQRCTVQRSAAGDTGKDSAGAGQLLHGSAAQGMAQTRQGTDTVQPAWPTISAHAQAPGASIVVQGSTVGIGGARIIVPMMQLSQGVFWMCISSWSSQRVEATLWPKQKNTCARFSTLGAACSAQPRLRCTC